MKNKRWIFWVIALANLGALAVYIARIPEAVVPIHYGIDGAADGWGSKWWLGLLGIIPVLLLGGYEWYRKWSQNKPRNMANMKYQDTAVPMITVMFVAISWFFATTKGETMEGENFGWVAIVMGMLMVFLSNMFGKISPNRNFGLRIPWTLKDDDVWRATHRMAGYWGVAGGIVMIASGIAAFRFGYTVSLAGVLVGVLILVVPPTIFAYRMYHRIHG